MHGVLKSVSLAVTIATLAGCAQLNNFNHTTAVSERRPQAIFVDAKQRGIYSAQAWDDQLRRNVLKFCAEPSPDALSAIAGGASGGLNVHDKVALQAAVTIAETAGSIGLRTQSIQLMRDSMYRLCEASLSHNVSPQFWSAFRYFQNSMVTILAVEQLTGVAKAPALQLTTNSSATPNKDVANLTATLTTAKATLAIDQADAATKKTALDSAQEKVDAYLKENGAETEDKLPADKADGYKPLKQAVSDAKALSDAAAIKIAGDQKTVDAYNSAITALGPVTLASSGTATSSSPEAAATGQAAVAEAVRQIVVEQLRGGFLRQTCATLYDQELAKGDAIAADTALHKACDTWAMRTAEGKLDPGQPASVAVAATAPALPNALLILKDDQFRSIIDRAVKEAPSPPAKRTPR